MFNPQEIIKATTVTSGNPKTVSIPLNNPAWARLISAFSTFTTDATAGMRSFNVDMLDSSGNILYRLTNLPMGPSQTVDLECSLAPNNGLDTCTGQELPELVFFPPNSVIKVTEANVGSTSDSVSMNVIITYC